MPYFISTVRNERLAFYRRGIIIFVDNLFNLNYRVVLQIFTTSIVYILVVVKFASGLEKMVPSLLGVNTVKKHWMRLFLRWVNITESPYNLLAFGLLLDWKSPLIRYCKLQINHRWKMFSTVKTTIFSASTKKGFKHVHNPLYNKVKPSYFRKCGTHSLGSERTPTDPTHEWHLCSHT